MAVIDRNVPYHPDESHVERLADRPGDVFALVLELNKLHFDQLVVIQCFVDGTDHFVGEAVFSDVDNGLQRVSFPG